MQDLIQQERFEMEVLDYLNSGQFLRFLVFCGGTMLRLCHGLDRYSVDLDFWLRDAEKGSSLLQQLSASLSRVYRLKDVAEKHHTLLVEFRSPIYPRSLKIEIRKRNDKYVTESAIAYSPHSTRQVLVQVPTLREMMAAKTAAFLDRGEVRDAYDMEFLVKRGMEPVGDKESMAAILARIEALSKRDYSVKLGSLLDASKREYYREHNFRILKAAIGERIRTL